jgi:molecular chaperone GrpE
VERDRQQATHDAKAELLRSLVATLDNLERALRAGGDSHALHQGVELIHRNLRQLLEGQGLVALEPVGEKFDPQRHQAIAHEPVPGFEDGTVVEVMQKGYFFRDRLLRPAMVKVAKGTADQTPGDGEPEAIH